MKPTFKFILIILMTSIILAGYALLPEKPLLVGDWGLRQIQLRRILTSDIEQLAEEEDTVYEKEETDTTKQRILFFGDSMVGALCYRMAEYAAENGHQLTCVPWISSTTFAWAKSDRLPALIAEYKPTYVFICLGSNELYTKDMDGLETRVRNILKKVGDVPTIWIGPPNWCSDGGINNLLKQIMGKRAFFPSLDLTFERQPDGKHPTNASSRKWMDAIAKWMNDGKSIHPILMNTPTTKKSSMKLIVIPPEHGAKQGTKLFNEETEGEEIPTEEGETITQPTENETPTAAPATPNTPATPTTPTEQE